MKKPIKASIAFFLCSLSAFAQNQAQVESLINNYYQEGKPDIGAYEYRHLELNKSIEDGANLSLCGVPFIKAS